ncbi:MAG: NUDIX domain-containing protein [archaeon]
MDELIDICDEKNQLLGIQKMKSEAHRDGSWHRASHIWIYNSKGEILLQLRAKEKSLYPDMWDVSVAGHVNSKEEPLTSGLREIEEEIGLKLKKEDLDFFKILKHKAVFRKIKNNEFYYIYFYKFDGNINKLKIQGEEVQEILFLGTDKIEEELKTNPKKFVPHGNYWYEMINEVKRRLNS